MLLLRRELRSTQFVLNTACRRGVLERRGRFPLQRPFAKLGPPRHSLRLLALQVTIGTETCSSEEQEACTNLEFPASATMSTDNDSTSASGDTETDNEVFAAGKLRNFLRYTVTAA
jgi:hypothetical protein